MTVVVSPLGSMFSPVIGSYLGLQYKAWAPFCSTDFNLIRQLVVTLSPTKKSVILLHQWAYIAKWTINVDCWVILLIPFISWQPTEVFEALWRLDVWVEASSLALEGFVSYDPSMWYLQHQDLRFCLSANDNGNSLCFFISITNQMERT